MAAGNVEIARKAMAEHRAATFDFWDPGVEVINAEGWVIETSYRGHEGLRRWWDDLAEAFGDIDIVLESAEEIGGGRVLTTQRFVGSFRTTAIRFDGEWASILWIEDGRVVRAQGFLSKRRAMKAAGIEVA